MGVVGREAPLGDAPPRDKRHRRHSPKTIRLAQEMYGDGGSWTPTQIARYLGDRGVKVSVGTVRKWVVPGLADHDRAYHREHMRRWARENRGTVGWERRMLELRRDVGLSCDAIARVLNHDFGLSLTVHQVRYRVGGIKVNGWAKEAA